MAGRTHSDRQSEMREVVFDGPGAASDGLLRPHNGHGGSSSFLGQSLPAPPRASRLHTAYKPEANPIFQQGFPYGLQRVSTSPPRERRGWQSARAPVSPARGRLSTLPAAGEPMLVIRKPASARRATKVSPPKSAKGPVEAPAADVLAPASTDAEFPDPPFSDVAFADAIFADAAFEAPASALPNPISPPRRLGDEFAGAPAAAFPAAPVLMDGTVKLGALEDRPSAAANGVQRRGVGGPSRRGLGSRGGMVVPLHAGPPLPAEVVSGMCATLSRPSTEPRAYAEPPNLALPFAPRLGPRGVGFGHPPPSAPENFEASRRRPPSRVPPKTADPAATAPALEPLPPKSTLPVEYHVRESVPVRPPDMEMGSYAADWDAQEETWQVTIFPAQRPDGREQVGHLRNCLNQMLRAEGDAAMKAGVVPRGQPQPGLLQILEGAPDTDRTYRVLHSIYASGIHELARQVSCHCTERGQLMMNVWTAVEALRERMLQMREERVRKAEGREEKLKAELAEAQEKVKAFESLEASNSSKASEVTRLTQSRDKIVTMMKTLQAALASVEEQLRTSQAGRKSAEAKLRTWLPHYDSYSTRAALEALEAHEAASRELSAKTDSPADLAERATRWRASVRGQAAQLADWESPPTLPDAAPLGIDAMKLLMQDAGRILGAVVCMRDFGDNEDDRKAGDGGSGDHRGRRREPGAAGGSSPEQIAQYEATISSLQQQLAEARVQLGAAGERAAAPPSGKRRILVVPNGAVSLQAMEPM